MGASDEWTRVEHRTWRSPELFNLAFSRADVEGRFGPAHELACDCHGVGDFDAWDLGFACGLEVSLAMFSGPSLFDGITPRPLNVVVYANQRDADHIQFHLGCRGVAVAPASPDSCPPVPPRFRVLRADDNGGVFEVARFTSACEAAATAAAYEHRAHKQMYWVEVEA